MSLIATIGQPRRGTGFQQNLTLAVSTCSFTWSWGVQPATGVLTYVPREDNIRIIGGAWLEINFPGRTFYGVVQDGPFIRSDGTVIPTVDSSGGKLVTLNFVDTRTYLQWDCVFGEFNRPEVEWVNGIRRKRYRHILPNDYPAGAKSYTTVPLSAAQILDAIFDNGWVETRWTRVYHPFLHQYPVYDVDAMSGRHLNDLVAEISERLGLVMTLNGGVANYPPETAPFVLHWVRKGVGQLPPFPENSDNNELKYVMTGHPTRVNVIGERNRYLVLNLTLERDWNRSWAQFWDLDLLADDLFNNTPGYNNIAGDIEQIQGRQLAAARAREITVREYAQLRRSRDGADFTDYRKFQGRSRMDMPAALYIRMVVNRAFRPPASIPIAGTLRPLRDLNIVDDLPAGVDYDANTGAMSATVNPNQATYAAPGGNGFAVVRGYQVGVEVFRAMRPERFDLNQFRNGQAMWRPLSFQVDDSGVDGKFVVFDEPILDLTRVVTIVDGHAVFVASPQFNTPQVKACLTFEAERFNYRYGTRGGKDAVVNVPGLRAEYISSGHVLSEIPYGDGVVANTKAYIVAEPYLLQPWYYPQGGYTLKLRPGDTIPQLTAMLDRVSVEYGPNGHVVRVDFASERPPLRPPKQYERDLDRASQMVRLLPGQRELQSEANLMRVTAAAFRQDPSLSRQLGEMFHGRLGAAPVVSPIMVENGSALLPAGTPLWKPATVVNRDGQATKTRAVMPSATSAETPHFVGVTVREQEDSGKTIRVQASGEALVRVLGPVEVEDVLCRADGMDYLKKADEESKGIVGRAMQAIAGPGVKLIIVQLGMGGGGGGGGGGETVFVWG